MSRDRETNTPSTLFFIQRLSRYQPLRFTACACCWILYHSWHLIPGLLAKAFFDILEGHPTAGLTFESIVVLILVAGLAKVGTIYGGAITWAPLIFKSQGLLRRNLLTRILDLPGAKALPWSIGEAISTLRDDVEAAGEMTGWVFNALAGLIFAVGGIAILLYVNARVTLLVFIPIAIVMTLSYIARTRLEHVREQSRLATAEVTGSIGEIFYAVQAIQVAGAESNIVAHLRKLGDVRQQMMLRDQLLGLSLDAIFANTANLGAGLTLLVAASAMRTDAFTIGDFALFATYLMQVASYTQFFGYLIRTYRQSGVSFKRAVALLQGASPASLVAYHPLYLRGRLPATTSPINQERDRLNTLEVSGLTLRYPGSEGGIENVSFEIKRGELTVITGRIGSGKTTLLRAMLGLLEPQAGEIRWNNRTVEQPAHFFVAPRTAYTAQVPTLLSGTLRENILLGLHCDNDTLERAIHHAVLDRDIAKLPDGLETLVGPRGMKLSGGQIQRTAAARMFVRAPEILIFDDLSSALDIETEILLWQRLIEQEITCLAVSHRPMVLAKADQILILEDGKISARGTLKELLRTSPEMQQLYIRTPSDGFS